MAIDLLKRAAESIQSLESLASLAAFRVQESRLVFAAPDSLFTLADVSALAPKDQESLVIRLNEVCQRTTQDARKRILTEVRESLPATQAEIDQELEAIPVSTVKGSK